MVKPKDQIDADQINNSHPLMRETSAVGDLMKKMQSYKDLGEFKLEQLEEWKDALNRIASSPDGQLLFKTMLRFSNLLAGDEYVVSAQKLVEDRARSAFWRRWIRPYLAKELRAEIEP